MPDPMHTYTFNIELLGTIEVTAVSPGIARWLIGNYPVRLDQIRAIVPTNKNWLVQIDGKPVSVETEPTTA